VQVPGCLELTPGVKRKDESVVVDWTVGRGCGSILQAGRSTRCPIMPITGTTLSRFPTTHELVFGLGFGVLSALVARHHAPRAARPSAELLHHHQVALLASAFQRCVKQPPAVGDTEKSPSTLPSIFATVSTFRVVKLNRCTEGFSQPEM